MQKKRIYIADDQESFIDMIAVYLEGIGYEATGSTQLLDLILLEATNLPDIFLLNILIWGEDSDMISSYLKNNELTAKIPVVLFTTLEVPVQKLLSRYPDGFISIPSEIHKLPDLLKNIIS